MNDGSDRRDGIYWVCDLSGELLVAEWMENRWINVLGWAEHYVGDGVHDKDFSWISPYPLPPPSELPPL